MDIGPILDQLAGSLADGRLARGERQELAAALEAIEDQQERAEVRRHAFEIARAALDRVPADAALDWLDQVVKTLYRPAVAPPESVIPEAWFSPSRDCAGRIVRLLDDALRDIEICVFTITDDRISSAALRAHGRGVSVRVITDNDKSEDLGSDVERLQDAGVPLRVDRTEFHMHHKFAIFDQRRLLTGSYNWTRGAARDNQENFLVTGEPRIVAAYQRAFEDLWDRLGPKAHEAT